MPTSGAPNYARASHGKFKYVYILQSESEPERHYTGLTDDLKSWLCKHNAVEEPHTSKHRPWKIRAAIAFGGRARAAAFEKYLKSHSGRVFALRHF